MASSQSKSAAESKNATSTTPKNSTDHGNQEQSYASPMLEWLCQSDRDEPWRGFTVVTTDQQNWKTRNYSTENHSQTWSTRAEAGSEGEGGK
ncbi:hypothetical protein FBEOM_4256 [Fusarium beomiforme]|uniref:Uncharacterized protein n=1 Tax=Fusarium beomiforme TaxID=44412 RepID=A0A9P5ANF2_9HYPO|nr:hypothetical protein FBEOM_4256 [Fusarium beomiforme]